MPDGVFALITLELLFKRNAIVKNENKYKMVKDIPLSHNSLKYCTTALKCALFFNEPVMFHLHLVI